ncbi:hypothetical protein B4113_3164 [Geobacillus sp. B4113_201601]|nr:hypothetical protein B4113_3164 [Geobacillus sp. B4113_201601]
MLYAHLLCWQTASFLFPSYVGGKPWVNDPAGKNGRHHRDAGLQQSCFAVPFLYIE